MLFASCLTYLGDYSIRVPPLPIPNREVKPDHADGTASSGRVGSCRFRGKPPYHFDMEAFCVYRYNISFVFPFIYRKFTSYLYIMRFIKEIHPIKFWLVLAAMVIAVASL